MDADSPIPWRLRSDLQLVSGDGESGVAWVVKDPLQLRYFRMEAEEMALLKLLDGRAAWGDVLRKLAALFPRTRFSEDNLVAFLGASINNSLLVSTQPGHGARLAAAKAGGPVSRAVRAFGSLLTIRWRGLDPTRLLAFLHDIVGWMFRPAVLVVGLLFVVSVLGLMVPLSDRMIAELPRLSELTTVANLPYLVAAFVFVKLLHELGHGLACRHYGGECHELGVLFIALFPLLYCDVSDAWLFRSRWHRVLVSAAGILVELFLAAVFALLWYWSVPGPIHTFFLNIVIVASVNTLLINGNPLLRYDGYYVLADALAIPNLGPESRRAAWEFFERVVLGHRVARSVDRTWLSQAFFVVFGLASACYRVFILVVILWIAYVTVRPYGLEPLVLAIGVAMGSGMVVGGVRAMKVRSQLRGRSEGRGAARSIVGLAVFALILVGLLLVPLPRTVAAPFVLLPGACAPSYVMTAGYSTKSIEIGSRVEAADVLLRLENEELERSVAAAEGEVAARNEHLTKLEALRSTDAAAAAGIPAAKLALASAEEQLNTAKRRAAELVLRSDASGYVFPARGRNVAKTSGAESLGGFEGTPLDPENRGAWLDEQTLVCWVGDATDVRMRAYVEQPLIPFVLEDAVADVCFSSFPGKHCLARVEDVSVRPVDVVEPELVMTKRIAASAKEAFAPIETMFRVDLALSGDRESGLPAPLYSTGVVKIECRKESLLSRFWRLACHTFAINVS